MELSESIHEGLVLDIDDTLSHTHRHWVRELHVRFGGGGFTAEEILERFALTEEVPHWREHPEALRWMEEARHSDPLQEEFLLIEDAKRVLPELQKIIPLAGYLTARPESVRGGTLRWLRKHGLPELPLIMRPKHLGGAHAAGSSWKAEFLPRLYPKIQGIIDDSASLARQLPGDYAGVVFLYNGRGEVPVERSDIEVIPCTSWDDILLEAKHYFKTSS